MAQICDVFIVGGALSGLSMALALAGRTARKPLRVVVADARPAHALRSRGHDGRASALTAASRNLFRGLGIWDNLQDHAAPLSSIVVTDSDGNPQRRPTLLSFPATPGHEPSAWFMDNHDLLEALQDEVARTPAIQVLSGAAVKDYRFGPGLATISMADGSEWRANLVVAADGRTSGARTAAGISLTGWSYPQSAIVTSVSHEFPHGGRAEEHFRSSGPFAILPLPGNRSSIVWTELHAQAQAIMALDDAAFETRLRGLFGDHLGKVRVDAPRHVYPLSLWLASDFVGPRLALVGDAGHIVHPMAGLGFNLGLKDVAALAETIVEASLIGLDIGSPAVLERYTHARRFDTVATAFALEGLNQLFSNSWSPVRLLRQAGLLAVNAVPPVRSALQAAARGTGGRVPRLLEGLPA